MHSTMDLQTSPSVSLQLEQEKEQLWLISSPFGVPSAPELAAPIGHLCPDLWPHGIGLPGLEPWVRLLCSVCLWVTALWCCVVCLVLLSVGAHGESILKLIDSGLWYTTQLSIALQTRLLQTFLSLMTTRACVTEVWSQRGLLGHRICAHTASVSYASFTKWLQL